MTKEDKTKIALLALAIIVPFGLTALGVWKAYEIYKDKTKDKDDQARRAIYRD